MTTEGAITVSVTALAEFTCRSGDLEPHTLAGPTARQGQIAHQQLQRSRTEESEVTLSAEVSVAGITLRLGGRIDLLDREARMLGEIKTTMVPVERVPASRTELHWAQLTLYAFLFQQTTAAATVETTGSATATAETIGASASTVIANETKEAGDASPDVPASPGVSESRHEPGTAVNNALTLKLLYVNLLADSVSTLERASSVAEVEVFALAAVARYVHWFNRVQDIRQRFLTRARSMSFPYTEFRTGQRHLAAAIYRTVRDGGSLLAEAPTGSGKTISAMFASLKALGQGKLRKLVYLTSKVSGRDSALQSVNRLNERGLGVLAIALRSRQAGCFCQNGRCERDDQDRCPMTRGFHDRLPDARIELLDKGLMDGPAVDEVAWTHQVCPTELALQMLPWVHIIICDYNHVFDPLARLTYLAEEQPGTLLLLDEAHNLPARSRDMLSARLELADCVTAANKSAEHFRSVSRALKKLCTQLRKLSFPDEQEPSQQQLAEAPKSVQKAVLSIVQAVMDESEQRSSGSGGGALLHDASLAGLLPDLLRYTVIHERYDEWHRTLVTRPFPGGRDQLGLQLLCVDASVDLSRRYQDFQAVVMLSATLRPALFYRDSLGLPATTQHLSLNSPFGSDALLPCLIPWIDTRYRQRARSLSALVRLINDVSVRRPGNYMVFLPSYAYLAAVRERFAAEHPDREIWSQSPGDDASVRREQVDNLATQGHRVGFAILGGSLGEGVDYPGELLVGVMVVGPGLAGQDLQQDLVAEASAARGFSGYDFAYRYPAVARVLQSAGRVIRHEQDRGVLLLIDPRFREVFYRELWPEWWALQEPASLPALLQLVDEFWDTRKQHGPDKLALAGPLAAT